jgi:divalent metal cation (Fe/Co/Zn/Cd) transporter
VNSLQLQPSQAVSYGGICGSDLPDEPLAVARTLGADAKMNKADWLTASAAMVGVVGIGFGLWWADTVAAALISLDITHDGFSNLRRAVVDLMDQTPTTIDQDEVDPLRDKLTSMLQDLDWVDEAEVRLREEGQVYFGEAFVVPSDETNITEKIEDALKRARDLDWRIYDLALMPVRELPEKGGQAAQEVQTG